MPRKNKKSHKTFAPNPSTRRPHSSSDGEVFRNFFAVNDDVDPRISLQCVKEMFHGKVEEDVILMIFSECAYDVDQTVETLFALTSEHNPTSVSSSEQNSLLVQESSWEKSEKDHLHFAENEPAEVLGNTTVSFCTSEKNGCAAAFSESPVSENQQIQFYDAKGISEEFNYKNASGHHNPVCAQSSMVEKHDVQSEKSTSDTDGTTWDQNNQSLEVPSGLKAAPQTNVTPMPESSGRRQSPFYTSSPTLKKPWENYPHNVASSMLNTHGPPHFITPLFSLQNKFQETSSNTSSDINGLKSWFTIRSMPKSNLPANVNDISSRIIDGYPVFVLLRGLPGSGKSTLAKELKFSGVALSTDDYFSKNGKYRFDLRKLSEAHEWNKRRALNALQMGITPIIIDNTNTEAWEMLPYVKYALEFNYEVYILEPNTPWKFKPNKLAKRNSHHVSLEKIERMLERYDHTITVQSLKKMLKSYGKSAASSSSSERESIERDNVEDGMKYLSDTYNRQCSSSDSLIETCGLQDSQLISSEVEVHKEQDHSVGSNSDQSAENGSDAACTNKDNNLPNNSNDQGNTSPLNDENPCLQEWSEINDIDKLKLLMREGSEESQSCGLTQQSSDSSQEVAGWEAITEPDEDFLWSGSFGIQIITNPSGIELPSRNICSDNRKQIVDVSDESHKDDKHLGYSSSVEQLAPVSSQLPSVVDNVNFKADSVEKNVGSINTASSFGEQHKIISNVDDWTVVEPDDAIQSWNAYTSSKKTFEAKISSLEPKPQRELFQNSNQGIKNNKLDEGSSSLNSITSECHNESNSTKLVSLEHSLSDWTMPAFESQGYSDSGNDDKAIKNTAPTNIGTQTDPHDFLLCHKLETNELFVTCMKTLKPSSVSQLIVDEVICEAQNKNDEIPWTFRLDKSTSTADIPQDIGKGEKMKLLQSCFPEISEEDLLHLLEMCHGDNVWLSSILMEWGYKYNMPKPNFEVECEISEQHMSEENNLSVGSISPNCNPVPQKLPDDAEESGLSTAFPEKLSSLEDCNDMCEESFRASNVPLKLVLSSHLASDLQQLFGPVLGNNIGDVPEHLRTVVLGYDLAQSLFNKWKESVSSRPLTEIEAEEKKPSKPISRTPAKYMKRNSGILSGQASGTKEPDSLSEIMAMEYAIQLSRDAKLRKERANCSVMATRIKRTELHRMFPGVDTLALDDVFESNNYNLEKTLLALEADVGKPAKIEPGNLMTGFDKLDILKELSLGNWADWVHEDGFLKEEEVSSIDSTPEAEQWRAEAAKHYQIHQECVSKARSAFYNGMREVASFYSQKGSFHKLKFKAANKKASELIIQNRNADLDPQVLDLHGLYVQEAIPELRRFLKASVDKMNAQSHAENELNTVTIITGRGAHSIRGAKLRPSVIKFLNSCGYRFDEINLGVFNICLSPS